jgi:hypothetical protein
MIHGNVTHATNELINTKPELLIVFAGDSHTWGQGATGWSDALKPAFVAGEWRRLPEHIPCFAQLFGEYMKRRRNVPLTTYTINSGYGCASTKVYLNDYWNHAVEIYKPDIVVMEFAINDWLSDRDVNIQDFGDNLNCMIDKCISMGSVPILLTVSPIRGSQYSGSHYYPAYIECIRTVACERPETVIADANKLMLRYLEDNGEMDGGLFADDLHVAQPGQELYCRALIEAVEWEF